MVEATCAGKAFCRHDIAAPPQKGDTGTCNWITRLMWPLRCTYCVCKVMSTRCVARLL